MKSLNEYIQESIKPLDNKTGIIVFDIDDTLLKVDTSSIFIYKHAPGSKEIALTTSEYAKDPDVKTHREWFDYRDLDNEQKVYQSIVSGLPVLKNIKILNSYINAGYDFCFLTARGCEEVIKSALDTFFQLHMSTGIISDITKAFKKTLSHAVNEYTKHYKGSSDAEKKANILKQLCRKYKTVVFVDDDIKNLNAAKNLHMPNLKLIKAHDK